MEDTNMVDNKVTTLLDLIAASAAPLDEESLLTMLQGVENTPCYPFWDRVSSRGETNSDPVAWTGVEYKGANYILVQMPDDSLIGLPLRNDVEQLFWFQTLGLSLTVETSDVEPESEEYEYACRLCGEEYDDPNDYDLCLDCNTVRESDNDNTA